MSIPALSTQGAQSGAGTFDIMFSPSGEVIGNLGSQGKIVFWLRDTTIGEATFNGAPVRGGRAVASRLDRLVTAGIPVVAEAVLSRLDLTDIVVRHVDIDQVVKTVDLDAAVNQVDLLGVAQYVIDGVNLPAIVRSSSASFTTEAVHGLRVHGVEADQAVARVVGHLIPRRRSPSS